MFYLIGCVFLMAGIVSGLADNATACAGFLAAAIVMTLAGVVARRGE